MSCEQGDELCWRYMAERGHRRTAKYRNSNNRHFQVDLISCQDYKK